MINIIPINDVAQHDPPVEVPIIPVQDRVLKTIHTLSGLPPSTWIRIRILNIGYGRDGDDSEHRMPKKEARKTKGLPQFRNLALVFQHSTPALRWRKRLARCFRALVAEAVFR